MNAAQTKKLLRLGEFLITMPKHGRNFDMQVLVMSDAPGGMYGECGTAACACGWATLEIEPQNEDEEGKMESYQMYSERVFGLESAETLWLFAPGWAAVDNTPWGAAARIAWLVLRGLPKDAIEQLHQFKPLCYLPPGATV